MIHLDCVMSGERISGEHCSIYNLISRKASYALKSSAVSIRNDRISLMTLSNKSTMNFIILALATLALSQETGPANPQPLSTFARLPSHLKKFPDASNGLVESP